MNYPQGEEKRGRRAFPFVGIALALMFAGAAFFSGLHIGSDTRSEASIFSFFAPPAPKEEVDMRTFWRAWNTLEERFVYASTSEPLSVEERVWAAIEGLSRAYGDPYTTFFPPEEASVFEEDISGNFEGVGMEIGLNDEGDITVIAPLPGTPAEAAGLLPGDVIVSIDEILTRDITVDEAVQQIRGEKGSVVTLGVVREEVNEVLFIDVTRDRIDIPTITVRSEGEVFIIELFNFSAVAEARMEEALDAFRASGKEKLVIDLRGNPGGFLDSAVNIASHFLETGKVVLREDFGGDQKERVYRSSGRNVHALTPETFVVLVDGGSASASEILAGALREHNVATLIGDVTFGKGSVQELVDYRDGSSLKVTVARWLTPEGTSISEGGLTPDVLIELTPEDREVGNDPQLEAALDFLQSE